MKTSELQEHLYTLEERLFHPDREADRTTLVPVFADEYKEFCATGRIYNRDHTVDVLLTHDPHPTTIRNYYVMPLGKDAALATYRASSTHGVSHRSSVWVFREDRWQLLFHQSTAAT
jgi:hypothetical protein